MSIVFPTESNRWQPFFLFAQQPIQFINRGYFPMSTYTNTKLFLAALIFSSSSFAQTLCPDGSYVGGGSCSLAPDGSYVGGDPELAPNGTYVGGEPSLAPDGTYVGGDAELAPDGSYVGGQPRLAPDGSYVGNAAED